MRPGKEHEYQERHIKKLGTHFSTEELWKGQIGNNSSMLYFVLLVSYLFVDGKNCPD